MTDFDHIAENMLIQLWERVRFVNEGAKPEFTASEMIVLRLSWTSFISGDLAQKGFDCFLRMFKNNPETQQVFEFAKGTDAAQMQNSSRLLFHVTRVMKNIGKVVENLDSLEDVVPILRQLGGRHGTAGYNVPPEYFPGTAWPNVFRYIIGGRHGTAGYNVPPEYFPFLGVAMRELMKESLKNWDEKKEKLWEKLYIFIIDQLKAGQKEYGSKVATK